MFAISVNFGVKRKAPVIGRDSPASFCLITGFRPREPLILSYKRPHQGLFDRTSTRPLALPE